MKIVKNTWYVLSVATSIVSLVGCGLENAVNPLSPSVPSVNESVIQRTVDVDAPQRVDPPASPATPAAPAPAAPAVDAYDLAEDPWDFPSLTVTNRSTETTRYVFVLYTVGIPFGQPGHYESEVIHNYVGAEIPPGESRTLTVAVPAPGCEDIHLQADLYPGVTTDDVASGRVAVNPAQPGHINEVTFEYHKVPAVKTAACEPPPPTCATDSRLCPPVDVCPNLEGNQLSVPVGYTKVEGQCVPIPPPPLDLCPNLQGVQTTIPQGLTLQNGSCLPPPPSCSQINPPSATIVSLTDANPPGGQGWTLTGIVNVKNDGLWEVRLLAASSMSEYTNNHPDFVKDTGSKTLSCGSAAFSITVDYEWNGHGSEYWWLEVRRNGAFFSKEAVRVNTHN